MAEPSSSHLAADFTPYGLIPQLPDELSVRILACLPRSSHPVLALVSRSWRSFLRSPLLFTLRSQLAATEPCLCVNIHIRSGQSRWFFLNHHPCRLLPLPPLPFPTYGSACVTIGPSLFVLGGSVRRAPSDAVQVFDARLGTWTTLPPMGVSRQHAAAGAIGGRIYVLGGCPSSDSWAEVLDPTSGMWAPVPSPPHLRSETMRGSAVLGARLLVTSQNEVLGFDQVASLPWDDAMPRIWEDWCKGHAALVDGVIYFEYPGGNLFGYDTAAEKADEKLKRVDGLDGKLPYFMFGLKMANMGGLLCLVWRKSGSEEWEIECAGIEVTRMSGISLWGSVVWRESSPTPISDGSWLERCVTLEF